MTKSIRTVLTPLLIISYVSGLIIIEFPVGCPRVWLSFLYMLLFWSIYFFLLKSVTISYFNNEYFNADYHIYYILDWISIGFDILLTLLSIVFGMYYDKKFRNCLRKIDIVDNTLLNIGTSTDFHKLYKKTMCLIIGWLLMITIMTYGTAYYMRNEFNYDILTSMYIFFVQNYCFFINIINDFIIISIFGYIGLKFDQVNQHLLNLTKVNEHKIKRAWENSIFEHRFPQTLNNECLIWIVIHLHSELRKISREINSIFGVQMTFKMGCIFFWLALDLREFFSVILINNYVKSNKTLFTVISLFWICYSILKLFFINYVCEIVNTKANTTGNLINKMPNCTYDTNVREHISQLILQITQAPIRFYGIGLFQYGYKFLYGLISSITTIVVLLIQACINKKTLQRNND